MMSKSEMLEIMRSMMTEKERQAEDALFDDLHERLSESERKQKEADEYYKREGLFTKSRIGSKTPAANRTEKRKAQRKAAKAARKKGRN